MKYYIRTTGKRELDETYNQISYTKLIDKEHRYIDFFVDKLEELGNEDCVIIEDDCVLCQDFKKLIEEAISKYPNKIINFFYWGMQYFKTKEDFNFVQNQCTYYPKGLSIKLAQEMRKVHKEFPNLCTDQCECIALERMNETHIQYRPCLVQHLNFDSLLGHKVNHEGLRTIFFIDYLKELDIDYNNLTEEDRIKLRRKMKIHLLKKKKEYESKIRG